MYSVHDSVYIFARTLLQLQTYARRLIGQSSDLCHSSVKCKPVSENLDSIPVYKIIDNNFTDRLFKTLFIYIIY